MMLIFNCFHYLAFFFFFLTFQGISGSAKPITYNAQQLTLNLNLSEEFLCDDKIFMFCISNNNQNKISRHSIAAIHGNNTVYSSTLIRNSKTNARFSDTSTFYLYEYQLEKKKCFYLSPGYREYYFEDKKIAECRDFKVQLRIPFEKDVRTLHIEEQGYITTITPYQFFNQRYETHRPLITVKWTCNDIKHYFKGESYYSIDSSHFFCAAKTRAAMILCTPDSCFNQCSVHCNSLLSFQEPYQMREYDVGPNFNTTAQDFNDFLGRFDMQSDDYMVHCTHQVDNRIPSYSVNNLHEDLSLLPEHNILIPFDQKRCFVISKDQIALKTKHWTHTNIPYNMEVSRLKDQASNTFFLKATEVKIHKRESFHIQVALSHVNIFQVMEACHMHHFTQDDISKIITASSHYQVNDDLCVWLFFHKIMNNEKLQTTFTYKPIYQNILSYTEPYILLENENHFEARINVFNKEIFQYICFRSADPSVPLTQLQSFMKAKIWINQNWFPISYYGAEYTLDLNNNVFHKYQCIYLSLLELELLRAKYLSSNSKSLIQPIQSHSMTSFFRNYENEEKYFITFFFKQRIPILEAHLFSQSIIKLNFASTSNGVVVNSPFLVLFHTTHSTASQFSISDLLYYYKEIETLPCNLNVGQSLNGKSMLSISNELKQIIVFNKRNEENIYRSKICSLNTMKSKETTLTTATLDNYARTILCLCPNGFFRIYSRVEISNCYKADDIEKNMLLIIQSHYELPIPPNYYSFHYTFDKNVKQMKWSLSLEKALQGVLFTTCFFSRNPTEATQSLKMMSIDISFEYLFMTCNIKPSRFTRTIRGKITEHCTMMLTSQFSSEEAYKVYSQSPYANPEYHHMYITQNFHNPSDTVQHVSVHLSQVLIRYSDLQKFTVHPITMQPQLLIKLESFCYSSTRAHVETPFGNYYRQHAIFLDTSQQNKEDGSSPCSIILIWQGKSYVHNTQATVKFLNTLSYYNTKVQPRHSSSRKK